MKAIIYLRRSAKSEVGTISLAVQEGAVRTYCAKAGMAIAAVVSHDGVSGTKRSRFKEIENAVRTNSAGALVVYHLDRLARDSAGLGEYLRRAAKAGIEIHESVSGRIDIQKALGKFVTHIRGAMDEFYAGVIGEKTKDALASLRAAGRQYSAIPPLGYRYAQGCLIEDPWEQQAVAIIKTCGVLGYGRVRTLRELRASGYKGRGSGATVQKLLNSP